MEAGCTGDMDGADELLRDRQEVMEAMLFSL